VFVTLNARGAELSFTVTSLVTLMAIAVLVIFFVSAIPLFDFSKYPLNIGVDPATGAAIELPEGNGPFLPFGIYGVLAAMPFAVWLFLAIEQLPLAAEESVDPKRDMPKGIMLGMFTLIVFGFLVLLINLVGLAVMMVVWFTMGGERAGSFIGGVLLNMAVFGAMFSYLLQALTFIRLRRRFPGSSVPSGARSAWPARC
jgi:amino acid transporter